MSSQALSASISMSNGEFMHVSNSILVLKEILPVFPLGVIHKSTGQFLDEALQSLLAVEKRGDIKILATSYQGQLRMAKREWAEPSDQTSTGAEVRVGYSSRLVSLVTGIISHPGQWAWWTPASCWSQRNIFQHSAGRWRDLPCRSTSSRKFNFINAAPVTS